jgi:hypothetical protein
MFTAPCDCHGAETLLNLLYHFGYYSWVDMRNFVVIYIPQDGALGTLMVLLATQGSYGFSTNPMSSRVLENNSYHRRADLTHP